MKSLVSSYYISISGLNLHHLLAYFETQKFEIKNLKREEKTLYLNISKKDFLKFKKTSLFSLYQVKIIKKSGFEKNLSFFVKHIGLFLGIVICSFSIFSATSKIQVVSILPKEHTCLNKEDCIYKQENLERVKEILKSNNIYEGVKTSMLPSNKTIEQTLMKEFKQISGVNIIRKGVYLYVDIIENKLLHPTETNKLIAQESGIVISIDVTNGEQKVKPGDIVLKGDILVDDNSNQVVATATIRTFYHETLIYDENQIQYIKTGESFSKNNISLFNIKINANANHSFKLYETKTHKRYAFLNLFLPIKIEETIFYELQKQESVIPYSQVENDLQTKLEQKTLALVPESASVINTTFSTHIEGSRTRLDCYIEAHLTITKN